MPEERTNLQLVSHHVCLLQKLYLLLGLLFLGVNGEKKINLDDIEKDNLRTEVISKTGHARPEETKYLAKPEIGQQLYQIQSQYNGPSSSPVGYVAPPSSQNVKQIFLSKAPSREYPTTSVTETYSSSFYTGSTRGVRSVQQIRRKRASLPATEQHPARTNATTTILHRIPATVTVTSKRSCPKYVRISAAGLPAGTACWQSTADSAAENGYSKVR